MAQCELLPFATTYLCETAFSAMLHITKKFRNRLDVGDDIRCCLFVRYVHKSDSKEELLFCSDLETTSRGADVMAMLDTYFNDHGLEWAHVCGVCTDGAPAMLSVTYQ